MKPITSELDALERVYNIIAVQTSLVSIHAIGLSAPQLENLATELREARDILRRVIAIKQREQTNEP